MTERLTSLAGLFILIALAWAASEKKRAVDWRLVAWGVGLQFVFAVLILKTSPGLFVFDLARAVMTSLLEFSEAGSKFLFGTLVDDYTIGAVVAFRVLPTIVFVSSVMAVLFHLGVVQAVVRAMAFVMRRTMRASGAEALMAAMFVFMGIEAITGVREYIRRMTRSELFAVMTGFMATIAGSVMAVYVGFGASAGHLLAASVMSAPAAIVVAKLVVPETGSGASVEYAEVMRGTDENVIEAAAAGAVDGLRLAATIGAVLIAFIAIIGMLDHFLGFFHTDFETLAGYVFTPFAFILGVPWDECGRVGGLLGVKVVFNEFISYQRMQTYIADGSLSSRSVSIATYALCGFANFGSLGILVGGMGAIAPERKREIARMGPKALAAGVIVSFMTAAVAGILL